MFKTISAFQAVLSTKIWWLLIVVFSIVILLTSFFVWRIKPDLQEAILSIVSIIFPLIAGFLTFGRESVRTIQKKISNIKLKDDSETGTTTTDTDKRRIHLLNELSSNFIDVIISTFYVSFILIIGLLIAKFNDFEFSTINEIENIKGFISKNALNLFFKIVFFSLIYTMLLNTLYLTIFVIRISKDDHILNP